MYNNFKEQAIEYVRQAVQEDNAGNYAKAFPLYMNALEYFKTHLKYEKNPKIKEAITQKFTEYLRRVEEILALLDEGGGAGTGSNGDAAVATRPKSKPKDGGEGGDGEDPEQAKLRAGLNSAIIREKPNVKWNDVAGSAVILPVTSGTSQPLQPSQSEPQRNTSENHPIQITTIRLNGDNFLQWSQSVRMYLRGRGKIGYITGDTKQPDVNDKTYAIWDAENSMVMTWLLNSMTKEISVNYLCYSTAKELWDNVSKMYFDLRNQSQVYELTLQLGEICQGEDSVTKYFNSLKRIWQDLDLFNDYEWKSNDDYNQYKKIVDTGRIFKFLAGLNVEYDEVRSRIIGRNPLPPIGEVFAEVRREESRGYVMLGKKIVDSTASMEGSVLTILEAQVGSRTSHNQRAEDKNTLQCDYCGKPRHTAKKCWKLHGKPPNGKGKKI